MLKHNLHALAAMEQNIMNLNHIIQRQLPPEPWAEGDNIPWNDPAFSERMLREHLSQCHGHASRQVDVIDRQVDWIHQEVLAKAPTKILELTCGPGLYTSRLEKLGHQCVGIDYSPASIRHARQTALDEGLSCTYRLEDVRKASFGEGYGLVMINNGQFNVFRRDDARTILEKARASLSPDGLLLLEPQKFATVKSTGQSGTSWYSCGEGGGLFSASPHLCLQESFWDPDPTIHNPTVLHRRFPNRTSHPSRADHGSLHRPGVRGGPGTSRVRGFPILSVLGGR